MTFLLGRRAALTGLGGLALAPLFPGCSTPDTSLDAALSDAPTSPPADATADAGPAMRDAESPNDAESPTDAGPRLDGGTAGWAAGGTRAMTGVDRYPDPFAAAPGPTCALTLPTTLGPCFFTSPERVDVSEGQPGLPVRLMLRVLDARCAPLVGARVDIWHTANVGVYSGGPIDFCTGEDPDARARLYFRGTQTSNERGIVTFDTCLPGAYRGRAIHIHFQVFPAGSPAAGIVSQLFFPQPLLDEVFATHPDYTLFPPPDTSNAADSIYRSVGTAALVEHRRMDDGAMLAWRDVIVRL